MILILASASVGRKKLLEQLRIPFEVMVSDVDEEKITGKSPLETLRLRARAKGMEVAKLIIKSTNQQISQSTNNKSRDSVILSADSGAILENKLYGKPKNEDEAIQFLSDFSGKTHTFITAMTLLTLHLEGGIEATPSLLPIFDGYDKSLVTFRKMSIVEIKAYLKITKYTRYAGGYALFASPQNFITKIEGSLSNVIGLSLEQTIPLLTKIPG